MLIFRLSLLAWKLHFLDYYNDQFLGEKGEEILSVWAAYTLHPSGCEMYLVAHFSVTLWSWSY